MDTRSLVDIVIQMVTTAKYIEKEQRKEYQYYMLLSGQDYLLKNMKGIERELEKQYPKPFIDCTPYSNTNWVYHKFALNRYTRDFHYWISHQLKKGFVRSAMRIMAILFTKICRTLGFTTYKRLVNSGVELYGGSAWWVLPNTVIDFILKELETRSPCTSIILDESTTPEETFFQIMIMRSPARELVDVNPPEMVLQNCKTYAYFFSETKKFTGHPHVFMSTDKKILQEKVEEGFWFARKFDITENEEILDWMDSQLLSETRG